MTSTMLLELVEKAVKNERQGDIHHCEHFPIKGPFQKTGNPSALAVFKTNIIAYSALCVALFQWLQYKSK